MHINNQKLDYTAHIQREPFCGILAHNLCAEFDKFRDDNAQLSVQSFYINAVPRHRVRRAHTRSIINIASNSFRLCTCSHAAHNKNKLI